MNILPIIFALVLMLSVICVERLERVKNMALVQKHYNTYLKDQDRAEYNYREEKLFGTYHRDLKRLTFRYILNKKLRDANLEKANQYKQVAVDLIKIIYGNADFYKRLEKERPNFIEEMLTEIEQSTEDYPEKYFNRLENISTIKLKDPQLQEAFYQMLKGTIQREKLLKELEKHDNQLPQEWVEKAYPSLLEYINNNDKNIMIQLSPRELLKAIFVKDEIVNSVIERRQELSKNMDSGSEEAFKNEFLEKRKPGMADYLLDFKITSTSKHWYN